MKKRFFIKRIWISCSVIIINNERFSCFPLLCTGLIQCCGPRLPFWQYLQLITTLIDGLHLLYPVLFFFLVKTGDKAWFASTVSWFRSATLYFWFCVSRIVIFPLNIATSTESCTLMFGLKTSLCLSAIAANAITTPFSYVCNSQCRQDFLIYIFIHKKDLYTFTPFLSPSVIPVLLSQVFSFSSEFLLHHYTSLQLPVQPCSVPP